MDAILPRKIEELTLYISLEPLYEEIHPRSKLGNRKVQHRFLD